MNAVILAHERALTLEPFTTTRPRSLIPVLNTPVLGHIVRQLQAAGIADLLVVLGHLADQVQNHMDACPLPGIHVQFRQVKRDEELPVCLAEILKKTEGPVLLVDGGAYMEDDVMAELVRRFQQHPQGILAALAANVNPLYHLQAVIDPGGRIAGFHRLTIDQTGVDSKPLPNMPGGCLIMDGQAAGRLAGVVKTQEPVTLADVLDACVKQSEPVMAAVTAGRGIILDYPWEILGASFLGLDLTFTGHTPVREIAPSARVHPNAILKGTIVLGENVIIESGAVLDNVMLAADCRVLEHSFVQNAVLGEKTVIGPTGYVKRTVLGAHSDAGYPGEAVWLVGFGKNRFSHHCHGGMGVYGEGAGLNAGAVVTANRDGPVKTKIRGTLMDTGWTNIGAFIGDYARINAQATIMPGRIIGARAVIGPGVIVNRDVPSDTMIVVKQQLEEIQLAERPV